MVDSWLQGDKISLNVVKSKSLVIASNQKQTNFLESSEEIALEIRGMLKFGIVLPRQAKQGSSRSIFKSLCNIYLVYYLSSFSCLDIFWVNLDNFKYTLVMFYFLIQFLVNERLFENQLRLKG